MVRRMILFAIVMKRIHTDHDFDLYDGELTERDIIKVFGDLDFDAEFEGFVWCL